MQVTDRDWTTLERSAESMVKAIVPEAADMPVYLADAALVMGTKAASPTHMGGTSGLMDLVLQPHLGDRWQGRGLAATYDRANLLCVASTAEDLADEFIGLVVHEVSHMLALDYLGAIRDPRLQFTPEQIVRTATEHKAEMVRSARLTDLGRSILRDHGVAFLRCAAHLKHRAERLLKVETYWPCIHRHHPGRPVAWLASRLGDEPERMIGATFAEILATPAPEEFVDLFAADVADLVTWEQRYGRAAHRVTQAA